MTRAPFHIQRRPARSAPTVDLRQLILPLLLIPLALVACTRQARSGIPPATSSPTEAIPESMKGYELSATHWESETYFTLSVGLNRAPPCEEGSDAPADAALDYTVKGLEALKQALGRLPRGEYLFLCPIEPPDRALVEEIEALGRQLGLKLSTMNPAEAQ